MRDSEKNVFDILTVGAGPAGMCAAIFAARSGASVGIVERNGRDRPGKKLAITGKGRCNVTNECDRDVFLASVRTNPRFLYSAFAAFPPSDVISFFESAGVPLKTERGRRVFPQSDRARDVVDALVREADAAGVKRIGEKVTGICEDGGLFKISGSSGDGPLTARRVILATGGRSYQLTGSDGSGYRLASQLGHRIVEPRPSLVPIICRGDLCARMMGLSLKNVALTLFDPSGKRVYEDFGEMLFTHFGISGPMALSASCYIRGNAGAGWRVSIDLKPALNESMLDARILSDFSGELNRDLVNSLSGLLPSKMIEPFVELSGIPPHKKVNSVTREERASLVRLFKNFELQIAGLRPIDEAIVTSGGVDVAEIDPKTMESKLVPGLYFAGEIIDVDAFTGGYNLQICWSTGKLAGVSAAASL
ncbi:MAG: NAD(P)/FAD-dependent oxidoreductase [Clostridia bacterium]|nr:NAD(P)/FAD-dependent oxidoreductase [Clostridia bacterium]MBP5269878.1 NAD(P)/FAD-dependent oxidoreductase [Clostridia bacterium]